MSTVRLLFTRSHGLASLAIRVFTWSDWSHVEIIDGDQVIGAEMFKGVHLTSLAKRLEDSSSAAVVEVACADPRAVIAQARSQLGKPYDYLGLLGFVTHQRNWAQDSDWFCSELVAWSFSSAGFPLFRADNANRITPQHLWLLPFPTTQLQANDLLPSESEPESQAAE